MDVKLTKKIILSWTFFIPIVGIINAAGQGWYLPMVALIAFVAYVYLLFKRQLKQLSVAEQWWIGLWWVGLTLSLGLGLKLLAVNRFYEFGWWLFVVGELATIPVLKRATL